MRSCLLIVLLMIPLLLNAAGDINHVVEKNETLSLIALNYTGNAAFADQIAAANSLKINQTIPVGYHIKIPEKIIHTISRYKVPDGLSFEECYTIAERVAGEENYFKAEGYFFACFVLDKNAATMFNYLLAMFKQQRYEDVIKDYSGQTYRSAKLSYIVGLSYEMLEKIDKAIDLYRESIAYEPKYYLPYKALNVLYKKMNKVDEADKVLNSFREQVQ